MIDFENFGRYLVMTGDLDPVYIAVHGADLDRPTLERWCLAYWFYYHAGIASRIAESADFWAECHKANDEKWPRGSERRHFRRGSASACLVWLSQRFPDPCEAVRSVVSPTSREVYDRIMEWPMFGPWIAFKAADMIERVLGDPVDFGDCDLTLYRDPLAGAALVAAENGLPDNVPTVVAWVLDRMMGLKAPPRYDRPLNVQEAETILCKWKSYRKGHYKIGKDSIEIAHALEGWGELADRIRQFAPRSVVGHSRPSPVEKVST